MTKKSKLNRDFILDYMIPFFTFLLCLIFLGLLLWSITF